jgi:predicted amidophosphoribosyltransferase
MYRLSAPSYRWWLKGKHEGRVEIYREVQRSLAHSEFVKARTKKWRQISWVASDPVKTRRMLFDHGERLARSIGAALGLELVQSPFERRPFFAGQKDLRRSDRSLVMKRLLDWRKNADPELYRECLFIDDLLTTGETLKSHALILQDQGLRADFLCLFRTPAGGIDV